MTARAMVRLTNGETVEGVLDFYLAFSPTNPIGLKQGLNTSRTNDFLGKVKGLYALGENGRPSTTHLELTTPSGSRVIVAGEAVVSVEVLDARDPDPEA